MRLKFVFIFCIFLIAILAVSVFAIEVNRNLITSGTIIPNAVTGEAVELEPATKTTLVSELQKFYNIVKTEVDFYSSVVSSMTALVPSDKLTSDITKLQADLVQIQAYADSGNRTDLNRFVKNTLEPDRNMIKQDILAWRNDNYKSLTLEQKASLKANFTQSLNNFKSSRLSAYKTFAYGRIYYFENTLGVYQNRINAMQSKGLNLSSLNQLITDCRTTIITPLQNEINSATDASSLNQAVKKYAIFDGSETGINFHLAAKFNVGVLEITLDKLTSVSGVTQDALTRLRGDINTANSALNSVGTSQYTTGQERQIWNAIKDGYSIIKALSNPSQTT